MKNTQAPKLVLHCPSLCGSLSLSILPLASQVALVVKNPPAKEWYFIYLFIFNFFFKFYFIFKLYNVVLVLPNIEMNPPQVYPIH